MEFPSLSLIFGMPGMGKTSLVEFILRNRYKEFRYGYIWSGSKHDDDYSFWDERFVSDIYDDKVLERILSKQRQIRMTEARRGVPREARSKMFIVFDDQTGHANFGSDLFKELITQRRHFGIAVFVVLHNITSVPPIFRENVDYVFIFKVMSVNMKKLAFENFGQAIEDGTMKSFGKLINSVCGDGKGKCLKYTRCPKSGQTHYYETCAIPNPATWPPLKVNFTRSQV